jgi:hypothetical protein
VSLIVRDKQRRVKEDLFALGLGDAMFDKVLLIIAFVPLKPGAAKEDFVGIIHLICILPSYTEGKVIRIRAPSSRRKVSLRDAKTCPKASL